MKFNDITKVDKTLQLEVLYWRNHLNIRQNMYTDKIISTKEHLEWLKFLQNNNNTKIFIASHKNENIGITSINNINITHKNADWAFYLNPDFLSKKGLGTLLEFHFLNYVFENFHIEKLNCEVLETNPLVIKMHKKFGFQEEGIKRKNIIKNDIRINIHMLGILKDEWNNKRNDFIKIIQRFENENR